MRLKAKLKWSIKDPDTAVYRLRQNEMASSPNFKSIGFYDISPISAQILQGIAFIVKLSDLFGVEPSSLFPLWGSVDSFGGSSLLEHLCSRIPPGLNSELTIDVKYFNNGTQKATLQSATNSICTMLEWPSEHFGPLMEAANVINAKFDLQSLSTLYRYVIISRLLGAPPKLCSSFFRYFFSKDQEDALIKGQPFQESNAGSCCLAHVGRLRRWSMFSDQLMHRIKKETLPI